MQRKIQNFGECFCKCVVFPYRCAIIYIWGGRCSISPRHSSYIALFGHRWAKTPPYVVFDNWIAFSQQHCMVVQAGRESNGNKRLSHTRWNCEYHISICSEVPKEGRLWRAAYTDWKDIEAVMCVEGSRNTRGKSMPGSHTHAGEYSAEAGSSSIYRVFVSQQLQR